MENILVSIIMGSDSDMKIMSQASDILEDFGIGYEIAILSAHRTPELLNSYVKDLKNRGVKVVISGAGAAAALPGSIASITSLPVVGVPIKSSNSLDGWDSILSILQMPSGIPVATVALDNARNAGLLAVRILSLNDIKTADKLDKFITNLKLKVIDSNKKLKESGHNMADIDML